MSLEQDEIKRLKKEKKNLQAELDDIKPRMKKAKKIMGDAIQAIFKDVPIEVQKVDLGLKAMNHLKQQMEEVLGVDDEE